MNKNRVKSFHSGTVKKSITIKASEQKVWRKISNIIGLPTWVLDEKKQFFSPKKSVVLV